MDNLIYIAPAAAVIGLVFGALKASSVRSADAGDDYMKYIAGRIQDGAMAFLKAEYTVLAGFVVVVAGIVGQSSIARQVLPSGMPSKVQAPGMAVMRTVRSLLPFSGNLVYVRTPASI